MTNAACQATCGTFPPLVEAAVSTRHVLKSTCICKSGIIGSCDVSNTFKEAVIFTNKEGIGPLKKVVAS